MPQAVRAGSAEAVVERAQAETRAAVEELGAATDKLATVQVRAKEAEAGLAAALEARPSLERGRGVLRYARDARNARP